MFGGGSAFGATNNTNTSSLFGTPAATNTNNNTSSLFGGGFGGQQAQPSSLFNTATNNTSNANTNAFSSAFGTQQPQQQQQQQQQTSFSLFNTNNNNNNFNSFQQQQQQQPQAPSSGLDYEKKLAHFIGAYHPQSPTCAFQFMFYNKVNPADVARYQQCPPNVKHSLWQQAVRNNPDKANLVVCPAVGFEALKRRIQQQNQAEQFYQQQLHDIQRAVVEMKQTHEEVTKVSLAALHQRHMELAHQLLELMGRIQVIQSRGVPLLSEEVDFRNKLMSIKRELSKPTQFQARVYEFASMIKLQQEERPSEAVAHIDAENLARLHMVLANQQKGLAYLSNTLKKNAHDIQVIKNGIAAATASAVAKQQSAGAGASSSSSSSSSK